MRITYLFLSAMLILSCSSSKKKEQSMEQSEMIDKVMAIHDEVMPQMSAISSFRKKAEVRAEELFSDSLKANDEEAMVLENLAIELEAANESMMVWMRSYHNDFEGMEHEDVMDYLEQKEIEISEVKAKMLDALEKAKSTFND